MQFPGINLTIIGADLLAKAQAGTTLTYTKIGLGDGIFPKYQGSWVAGKNYQVNDVVAINSGASKLICTTAHLSSFPEPTADSDKWDSYTGLTNPRELTGMVHKIMEVPISSIGTPGDGTCRIRFKISNKNLVAGFYLREIGVYANDPDLGEILYGIAFADETDYLSPGSGVTTMEKWIDIITVIDMAQEININIDEFIVTASKEDVLSVLRRSYFNINTIGV